MSAVAIALSVELATAAAEALADAAGDLMLPGALAQAEDDADAAAATDVLGVQLDDGTTMAGRDLSPGRARVTLYATPAAEPAATAALLGLAAQLGGGGAVHRFAIAAEDWNATWKAHFRALDLGRRLRVEPPWDRHPAGDRLLLVIDPGMAFGTGSHETTRLAAELLEAHADAARDGGGDLGGMRLLDVGTGSGLLAIAAAALGFGHVDGVDNDAVAVASARDNLRHNGLESRVALYVRERPDTLPAGRYDVVVANIISSVLLALRADLLARLEDGGLLLLSGVLCRERDAFVPAMVGGELELVDERGLGEWQGFALRLRRRG